MLPHTPICGRVGNPYPQDGEAPIRPVTLDAFTMAACAVTNALFREFVAATGYVTDAEKAGQSFVFHPEKDTQNFERLPHSHWWAAIPNASWHQPSGNGSSAEDELPVVHVSHNDAKAYCDWSGTRLPTEAEWEYSARGGLEGQHFPWGNDLEPDGEHRSN